MFHVPHCRVIVEPWIASSAASTNDDLGSAGVARATPSGCERTVGVWCEGMERSGPPRRLIHKPDRSQPRAGGALLRVLADIATERESGYNAESRLQDSHQIPTSNRARMMTRQVQAQWRSYTTICEISIVTS